MTLTPKPPALEQAELHWRDGEWVSNQCVGAHFSAQSGQKDSLSDFIAPHGLPARFAKVPEAGAFVIAESRFGAGLNFLATWQMWQRHSPSHAATLHFVSTEPAPLSHKDLERLLSGWPELHDFSSELLSHYPPLVAGIHRLVLARGRVRLTLIFGDAKSAWGEADFKADAWFFNWQPSGISQKPEQETIAKQISKLSKSGTTLSLTCAVENHRQALESAGFRMRNCESSQSEPALSGHFQPDNAYHSAQITPEKTATSVAIIGAGIAGCMLASNLAQRGYAVTLIDSANEAGSAASGNLQGALYVKLGVEFNQQTQLALSALTFSQQYYDSHGGQLWHPTGLLQLAWSANEQDRQRRFVERNQYPKDLLRPVTKEEAEALTGARLETGGLWFPGSGWLEPAKLCKSLASNSGIHKLFDCSITQIDASDGRWHLSTTNTHHSKLHADKIVVCAGHLSPDIIPGSGTFRFKAIRGQVTHLPEALADGPRAVICGARYLNPAHNLQGEQLAVIGATFDLHSDEPGTTTDSHRENILALSAMVPQILKPDLAQDELPQQLAGRVGFRCTTHDYQPVAGPFCDDQGQKTEGLYLLTGLGSKGLTYAPLLAEFLADQITGQPTALAISLARRLATKRMHQSKLATS